MVVPWVTGHMRTLAGHRRRAHSSHFTSSLRLHLSTSLHEDEFICELNLLRRLHPLQGVVHRSRDSQLDLHSHALVVGVTFFSDHIARVSEVLASHRYQISRERRNDIEKCCNFLKCQVVCTTCTKSYLSLAPRSGRSERMLFMGFELQVRQTASAT